MQHVAEIVKTLAEYGLSPLMVIFIGMFYLMGVRSGTLYNVFDLFNKNKQEEVKQEITLDDLYRQMLHLRGHFNDETTERLGGIETKQETILTSVQRIERKHEEYDKFGIKVQHAQT